MDISITEAKKRLAELIRAVERGEKVVITRHGKPVAQIAPPPRERRKVQWGSMRDQTKLLPGWFGEGVIEHHSGGEARLMDGHIRGLSRNGTRPAVWPLRHGTDSGLTLT